MLKVIPARAEHAAQIIAYLSITCYWKEFVEGNSLGQSYQDFMLEWVVMPRLADTRVLVDEQDESRIHGCVIAATTDRLGEMPDYTPHLHPKVMDTFGAWFQFPVSDSVVLELFALDAELRGQGHGATLYQFAEEQARQHGKSAISAFVWACFPDSLITLTRRGLMVRDCISFPAPVTVPLLYMEKNPEYVASKDLFQTQAYLDTRDLLLG
ncbi:GNAT family N-acetyltransferase [Pseudomonas panipatensis]|uniref:Acetyltransferase (GNAT) family protein n=1 Tax=Pseudomonas panipatensis TaxID=428992 RepID=A0A1G8FTS2_9PSED|nr:GNAT family N-acetyltransferase [Pseudomonas panipatensis]SDH85515.1 Acetyltransferase (GNAT) family protein [Pseudomonas panipatensis]SMP52333.1 Acetyltransferase (GNAT) family protein [Pseudomonas panipatensis]